MRAPLQSRSESSAERMLDATLRLLEDGGEGAVTVAAVARAAGTSNGSLYHRFGDRHGLMLAAQTRALGAIEAETGAAFARADEEVDDERAVGLLAAAAVDIFGRHRAAMRAFLVGRAGSVEAEALSTAFTHRVGAGVTRWLGERFGARAGDAEAAWRLLFGLGATRALFEDEQVSPAPVGPAELSASLARAVLAVVRQEAGPVRPGRDRG
ncbi:AcrR family transcriptional regulator [Nocardioides salarius]|uniref:AcrR family transcriptional regulator n=1 Tax=Nocardioides salarius TaxID=374513 RepID=A0ABS2M7R3_9ACTN|nr:TetR family transcriptional regulator [Nocardioides salarius]MBM7507232.1 AcrR family transcriptional regulator [Nocardioides salarius]